jgi:hypothetical protein
MRAVRLRVPAVSISLLHWMGGPEPVIPVIRWISDLPAHLLYKSELIDCTLNFQGLESIEDRTSPLRKKKTGSHLAYGGAPS